MIDRTRDVYCIAEVLMPNMCAQKIFQLGCNSMSKSGLFCIPFKSCVGAIGDKFIVSGKFVVPARWFQTSRTNMHSPNFSSYSYSLSNNTKRLNCTSQCFASFSQIPKENVTEDILKSKINPSSQSEEPKSDKKGQDKWYSGKNVWKLGLASMSLACLFSCGGILIMFGAPIKDPQGADIPDEFSHLPKWVAYIKRASKEMHIFKKMIQDPSSEKLLPDVLKEPWYQPPYTLVLEMTGVLVHPDWTLATGWRFKKRPGLTYFLQQVGPPLFEVVIYTHEQGFTAFPIIDSMDPNGCVMFRLFRDATKYVNGAHVKDLSFLNRDLSKVIIVDCDPKAMSLQPQNGFLLQKWDGNDSDRKLIDLAAFLRTIALSNVEDVRPVLEHYSQFDDPIAAFKEKQRLLQEQEEKKSKQITQQQKQVVSSARWSFSNWNKKN